jgi:peroxiredoxin
LEQHKTELENAGLQIAAISMGEPKHAVRYCGKFAPHIDCLVDETTKHYDAYGLLQGGVKEFITLNNAKRLVELASEGIYNGKVIGDWLMMPGFFIIDQQGITRYTYYAKEVSDHPQMDDVIKVAQTLNHNH